MELTDKLIALLKKGAPVYGTIQKSFSKNDALEILEECLKSRIAVLGGDVVNINNNGYFEYNYDNWSYNRKKGESAGSYNRPFICIKPTVCRCSCPVKPLSNNKCSNLLPLASVIDRTLPQASKCLASMSFPLRSVIAQYT